MRFSANLGFLWKELSLPDAIHAAALTGFDAVECHYPYDEDESAVCDALRETGLSMLGINTRCGIGDASLGFAALVGREEDSRAAVDEALVWAERMGVSHVHVMAGAAQGGVAEKTLVANLRYACGRAKGAGVSILIEPLNDHDAPGYYYSTTQKALDIIQQVGAANLKLMFDCYHVGRTEAQGTNAVVERLQEVLPHIGHIQFAAVPDRGTPDHGELDFPTLFAAIENFGWDKPLGAEYRVEGSTEKTLDWLRIR